MVSLIDSPVIGRMRRPKCKHEQILVRRDPDEVFARLTRWKSLPALIAVPAMLELVRGAGLEEPAIEGDMLLERAESGRAKRLFAVTSSIDALLWSLSVADLTIAGPVFKPALVLALRPAFDGYCLLALHLMGDVAESDDSWLPLADRLARIRDLLEEDHNYVGPDDMVRVQPASTRSPSRPIAHPPVLV